MGAIGIRRDRLLEDLRAQARRERDGRVCSRLLALANAIDRMSRAAAARLAGSGRSPRSDEGRRAAPAEVDQNARWVGLFRDADAIGQALEAAASARQHVVGELEQAFSALQQAEERYQTLLLAVIDVVDLCEALHTSEGARAIRHRLQSLLDDQGVERWAPEVGQSLADCAEPFETVGEEERPDIRERGVVRIVQPAYRDADGHWLRSARVIRARGVSGCQR